MFFKSVSTPYLNIDDWKIKAGECWAVIGRNGSGKKQLGQLLAGEAESVEGDYSLKPGNTIILSFESQQAFYENEIKIDDTDLMDHLDPGTTVQKILGIDKVPSSLSFLHLEPLLDRGYRLLSSGESRKVLLAKALLEEPDFLIVDEPYDSLDQQSKIELNSFFEHFLQYSKTQLCFLLNTWSEISNWHTHIAVIEKGEIIAQGEAKKIVANEDIRSLLDFDASRLPSWPENIQLNSPPETLVNLKNGVVRYGDTVIFKDINLCIKPGDHTLLTGNNGSGKSTLLSLISGDHPQCYSNDLQVLGFKRGQGESIWQIKKRMGIVSPSLHRDHRVSGTALHITVSGFFDSIGLYQEPSALQVNHAKQWLALVGLEHKTNSYFKQLSYGEQRLVLVARALVKQPDLLLLDEPTQGLDEINRHRLLYFLEYFSSQKRSTIVMVSHRQDEHLALFSQHVAL